MSICVLLFPIKCVFIYFHCILHFLLPDVCLSVWTFCIINHLIYFVDISPNSVYIHKKNDFILTNKWICIAPSVACYFHFISLYIYFTYGKAFNNAHFHLFSWMHFLCMLSMCGLTKLRTLLVSSVMLIYLISLHLISFKKSGSGRWFLLNSIMHCSDLIYNGCDGFSSYECGCKCRI